MAVTIPLEPGEPEQLHEIALDGEVYVLRLRWNTRDDAWYLDVRERDGQTAIALSLKVVLGVALGKTYQHPLFAGALFVIDESNTGAEAGLNDLGSRVPLVHLSPSDLVLATARPRDQS